MIRKELWATAATLIASGSGFANPALAATFSETLEQSLTTLSLTPAQSDRTVDTLSFTNLRQFSPQPNESLLGVKIEFLAMLTGQLELLPGAQPQLVQANFISELLLTGPQSQLLFSGSPFDLQTVPLSPSPGDAVLVPLAANFPGPPGSFATIQLAAADPFVQATLIGSGPLALQLSVTDQTTLIGATSPAALARQLSTTLRITYQTQSNPDTDPPDPDYNGGGNGNGTGEGNGGDDNDDEPDGDIVELPEPPLLFALSGLLMAGLWAKRREPVSKVR